MYTKEELIKEIEKNKQFLYLEYHSDVGLEFINLDRGMKYLKKLADKTKKLLALNKEQTKKLHLDRFHKDQTPLYDSIKDYSYLELKNVEIYKPVGLSCTLLELATLLDKYQDNGIRFDEVNLNPFNSWLIKLMNNPDDLSKLSAKDVLKFSKGDDIVKDFAKCFKGIDGVDRDKYHKLLKRNKDWDELSTIMDSLTELAEKKNLNDLDEALNNTVEMVNTFIDYVGNDSSLTISKPILKELSEAVYNLAQLSNVSSLYLTKMVSLVKSMQDNSKRLEEIRSNKEAA